MQSKIRTRDILAALLDMPSTAQDLAVVLGMDPHYVNAGLYALRQSGRVRITGRVVPNPQWSSGPHQLKLYELTPRGRLVAREIAKEPERRKNNEGIDLCLRLRM